MSQRAQNGGPAQSDPLRLPSRLSWTGDWFPYGGDYNPEQWPEEVWTEDATLMREAGVNFASVGIFSWSMLEPAPGRYETDWLGRVLDVLHQHDVRVDLATATAAPPPWFSTAYPESRPVDAHGTRYAIGSRQTWCASSPVYRERALALVEVMATRFGGHPALAMWHVSNELGCHNSRCYCDITAADFRRWLTDRYGDLDGLNQAWGTAFWSQRYTAWDQIGPPALTTSFNNPTQRLDFARFSSDALLEHYLAERDLLHRLTPGVPVTTNFMSMDQTVEQDYYAWGPHQDVVSTDHYLRSDTPDQYAELAYNADATRGMADGDPWLLMEHSPSAVNWQPVNLAKAPHEQRRTSLAHVARGADGVAYFQWRQSAAGAEKYHSAMLPHAGTDSDRWRETVDLGAILGRLAELRGSRVDAEVAIVEDFQSRWAATAPTLPSTLLDPRQIGRDYHRVLRSMGVGVDVVGPAADLSTYRVIIVPALYLCSDGTAARIAAAAEAGAQVVITFFSGIVDPDDRIRLGGYPGAFRDLLGVRMEEFAPLLSGQSVHLDDDSDGTVWSERGTAPDAKILSSYVDGPAAGSPVVTRRDVGSGSAWYVSTRLSDDALRDLVSGLDGLPEGTPVQGTGALDVDVVRRSSEGVRWLFVLNHGSTAVTVEASGFDLVHEVEVEAPVEVSPGDVVIIREAG